MNQIGRQNYTSKSEVIEKWQKYIKYNLNKSNSTNDERLYLAILELEVPYTHLGYESLEQFLLQVPNIGDQLLDQTNIFHKPSIVSIDYSSIIQLGDRVTWSRPNGSQVKGVVHWHGLIETVLCVGLDCDEQILGVEQESEVRWIGTILFHVRPGYGKILPVRDLMKQNNSKTNKEPTSILKKITKSMQSATDRLILGSEQQKQQNSGGESSKKTLDLGTHSVRFKKENLTSEVGSKLIYPRSIVPLEQNGLKVNDVVVCVTDGGTYNGIVMWLGLLQSGGKIYAGVDFQQNIGETDGTYGDYKLFRCKQKQGKFIPIDYLVKYDDYYESSPVPKHEDIPIKGINGDDTLDLKGKLNLIETEIQEFQIGDRIKYHPNANRQMFGIIKWLGKTGGKNLAGIDFDEKTDVNYTFPFEFKPGHGGLAPLEKLEHFVEEQHHINITDSSRTPEEFYYPTNPDLDNPAFLNTFIEPFITVKNFEKSVGFYQGIHGKNNSCYMDATLFLMVAYTDTFDKVLLEDDCYNSTSVRKLKAILRTDIANQLRRNYFCNSENISILRKAMGSISSRIRNTDMADIEEFLYMLFADGLKLNKFINYSSKVSEFVHQCVPYLKDMNHIVTTQKILENSMFAQNNLKFIEPPSPGLFLAMPRSNGTLVQYKAIVPSLRIDITHLLNTIDRQCTICSTQVANLECLKCFDMIGNTGMSATSFCYSCFNTFHNGEARKSHKNNVNSIYYSNYSIENNPEFKQIFLDLLGVICFKACHYVTFVKCGTELLAPWVMHNSMAEGGLPEIRHIPGLGECLQEFEKDPSSISRDWTLYLPEVQQILQDIYFCVYTLRKPEQ